MSIPNTKLASAGLETGSPLKSTIYTDLNRLLANDIDLDAKVANVQNSANLVNGQIAFRNCGGNCTGSCFSVCTGTCINACTNCTSCTSCAGSCTGCSGCSSSCSGH